MMPSERRIRSRPATARAAAAIGTSSDHVGNSSGVRVTKAMTPKAATVTAYTAARRKLSRANADSVRYGTAAGGTEGGAGGMAGGAPGETRGVDSGMGRFRVSVVHGRP